MKKLLVALALTLGPWLGASAQTEQGRWLAGAQLGNATYRRLDDRQGHQLAISAAPQGGYFVADNLAVGLEVPLSLSSNRSRMLFNSTYAQTVTRSAGAAPFVRYFIGRGRLRPFVGAAYSYSQRWLRYTGPRLSDQIRLTGYNRTLSGTAGAVYFIGRAAAVSATINYNVVNEQTTQYAQSPRGDIIQAAPVAYRNVTLGLGFGLFFGRPDQGRPDQGRPDQGRR